jgi:hypothetical protein
MKEGACDALLADTDISCVATGRGGTRQNPCCYPCKAPHTAKYSSKKNWQMLHPPVTRCSSSWVTVFHWFIFFLLTERPGHSGLTPNAAVNYHPGCSKPHA